MPGLTLCESDMNQDMYITPQRLYEAIVTREVPSLIVDCRSASVYHDCHIRGAANVAIPASAIMLRRLANRKMNLFSLVRGAANRDQFMRYWKSHYIILYDESSERIRSYGPCVMSTLFRRLQQEGCQVVCLQGGITAFKHQFSEYLVSDGPEARDSELTLDKLRITSIADSDVVPHHPDSGMIGGPSPSDPPFPVEILPYLFLGNAENSSDLESLQRNKICHVLNVTANLPNAFENSGLGIHYMQIPIQDHWSQNLAVYFSEAIAFIDDARQKKECVLVHCVAGISRSVTITLAYLMQKLRMPLNDAYDFVRQRKANISPNFNFMGQLMDFERQLNLGPYQCTCHATPCQCQPMHFITPSHPTPDSGIEMHDNWV